MASWPPLYPALSIACVTLPSTLSAPLKPLTNLVSTNFSVMITNSVISDMASWSYVIKSIINRICNIIIKN